MDSDFYYGDPLQTSTPRKAKPRRSVSLIDVTGIDDEKTDGKQKLGISNETIGSGLSGCKDSGYVFSGSSSSLGSLKETRSPNKKIVTLTTDELTYKDTLIHELQTSNLFYRLRLAEAENKITDLRLKCESHCGCCKTKSSCVDSSSHASDPSAQKIALTNPLIFGSQFTLSTLGNQSEPISDESLVKVRRWQETIDGSVSMNPSHSSLLSHGSRFIPGRSYSPPQCRGSTPQSTPDSLSSLRRIPSPASVHQDVPHRAKDPLKTNAFDEFGNSLFSTSDDFRPTNQSHRVYKDLLEDTWGDSEKISGRTSPRLTDRLNLKDRKAEMELRIRNGINSIALRARDPSLTNVTLRDPSPRREDDLLNSPSVRPKFSSLRRCLYEAESYAYILNERMSSYPRKLESIASLNT